MPNFSDHDFPVPNYLLFVSGYMFLESKTDDINNENPPSNDGIGVSELASETLYDTSSSAEELDGVRKDAVADNFWSVLIEQCNIQ